MKIVHLAPNAIAGMPFHIHTALNKYTTIESRLITTDNKNGQFTAVITGNKNS